MTRRNNADVSCCLTCLLNKPWLLFGVWRGGTTLVTWRDVMSHWQSNCNNWWMDNLVISCWHVCPVAAYHLLQFGLPCLFIVFHPLKLNDCRWITCVLMLLFFPLFLNVSIDLASLSRKLLISSNYDIRISAFHLFSWVSPSVLCIKK